MKEYASDIDLQELEAQIYKRLTPALQARAGRDANGAPIDAPEHTDAEDTSQTPETPARRGRGAPIGNQNARKHGLYSRRLSPDQLAVLPEARAAYVLWRRSPPCA